MSAAELNDDLRSLIDARLDVIDRVLVRAEIPWSERRSIVGEVETQIFELLARRGRIPTQDDVLEVLESLDPPESYLAEAHRGATPSPLETPSLWKPEWLKRLAAAVSRFGQTTAFVASLVIVNGVVLMVIAASDGTIQWIVTLAGLAWLNYAGVQRFRAWSAERRGHLFDEARRGLAAWLLSKDAAHPA